MKHLGLITVAAVSLLLSAPLYAQVSENATGAQPSELEQTPGLQQTPSGQTLKMAVEKDKPSKEGKAAPTGGEPPTTSTGPTFPNDKLVK